MAGCNQNTNGINNPGTVVSPVNILDGNGNVVWSFQWVNSSSLLNCNPGPGCGSGADTLHCSYPVGQTPPGVVMQPTCGIEYGSQAGGAMGGGCGCGCGCSGSSGVGYLGGGPTNYGGAAGGGCGCSGSNGGGSLGGGPAHYGAAPGAPLSRGHTAQLGAVNAQLLQGAPSLIEHGRPGFSEVWEAGTGNLSGSTRPPTSIRSPPRRCSLTTRSRAVPPLASSAPTGACSTNDGSPPSAAERARC